MTRRGPGDEPGPITTTLPGIVCNQSNPPVADATIAKERLGLHLVKVEAASETFLDELFRIVAENPREAFKDARPTTSATKTDSPVRSMPPLHLVRTRRLLDLARDLGRMNLCQERDTAMDALMLLKAATDDALLRMLEAAMPQGRERGVLFFEVGKGERRG